MDPSWEKTFDQAHLQAACAAWSLDVHLGPELFRSVENFVYVAFRAGEKFALRITHPLHRPLEQLEAELEWMDLLGQRGISVPEVMHSDAGERVVVLEHQGHSWYACLFRWIAGEFIAPGNESWQAKVHALWGSKLGQMQAISHEMNLNGRKFARDHWSQPPANVFGDSFNRKFPHLADEADCVLEGIRALKEDPMAFGGPASGKPPLRRQGYLVPGL